MGGTNQPKIKLIPGLNYFHRGGDNKGCMYTPIEETIGTQIGCFQDYALESSDTTQLFARVRRAAKK